MAFRMAPQLLYRATSKFSKEFAKMNATATQTRINYYPNTVTEEETSASLRTLRNSILTELPGVTFAVITLAYILLTFAGLK